jgi:hypothetical protein
MNREDIIRMAREQGLPETARDGVFIVNSDDLGRMLAAEREACAKVCDEQAARGDVLMRNAKGVKARDIYSAAAQTAHWNAAAIQARGKP